ncbi:ROK family protein [Fibrella sp. HMF5335]|uniref:ROK family protein n=1 Tax=Fibrella rubiginis TaxID=2817060 RepID=A0A939GB63_9BACT|nr:ROK family protein [Fibrella rubiginis]MBO0935802.1 ROK family protein [Fibrella rubiginis]
MNTIGIDLGGTRIKGVLIDMATGEVKHRLLMPTNTATDDAWKQAIADLAGQLTRLSDGPVQGIGLSAPGLPSAAGDAIAYLPNRLPGLEGFVWSTWLGTPVRVVNDAHAALLAEVHLGEAKGYQHVLMVTLGTGVGGGLWLNGQLHTGAFQKAGHVGHLTVDADSDQTSITGMPGSLEDAIGNATVARRSFGQYQSTHDLVAAYRQQEPLATLVWLTAVRQLAVALASLTNVISPELILIGGGIAQADDALFSPLNRFMSLCEWRPAGGQARIQKAHFDEWAGAIGAAISASNHN